MSVIAIALKHMLAAGLPHNQVVEAVAEMELEQRRALRTVPATVENKRRADRERMAAKRENERQSRDVARHPATSATSSDSSDVAEALPPSVSPTPPSTTPNPVTLLRPLKGAHGSQATGSDEPLRLTPKEEAQAFAGFWLAYPRKVGKLAAMKAFAKAVRAIGGPDPPGQILAAVEAAKRDWAATDVQFIPHPATWLNQGRWMDEAPAQPDQLEGRPAHGNHTRHPTQQPSNGRADRRAAWGDVFADEDRAATR